MFLRSTKKGQSVLEYALLLGVIAAGILIMQVFVKRGFQGRLKDSADRIGDQFSAGETTAMTTRTLTGDQTISDVQDVDMSGSMSTSDRTGGDNRSITQSRTDSATEESFAWGDYATETFANY